MLAKCESKELTPHLSYMCLSAFARSNKLCIDVTVDYLVGLQRSAIVRCADFLLFFWQFSNKPVSISLQLQFSFYPNDIIQFLPRLLCGLLCPQQQFFKPVALHAFTCKTCNWPVKIPPLWDAKTSFSEGTAPFPDLSQWEGDTAPHRSPPHPLHLAQILLKAEWLLTQFGHLPRFSETLQ